MARIAIHPSEHLAERSGKRPALSAGRWWSWPKLATWWRCDYVWKGVNGKALAPSKGPAYQFYLAKD